MFADPNSPMVMRATREWIETTVRGEYEKMAAERCNVGDTCAARELDRLADHGPWTADALLYAVANFWAMPTRDALGVLFKLGLDRHLTPGTVESVIGNVEIESEPSAEDVADLIAEITYPAPRSVALASFVVRTLYSGDVKRAHAEITKARAAHLAADRAALARLPAGWLRRSLVKHLRDVHGERP